MLIVDSCIKENLVPIIIPKAEKSKYISLLAIENIKEFVKWGLELQAVEEKRIEIFFNNLK